jgi:signal transduction histidine kinase
MIKDISEIREREQAILSKKMQTLYFASVAHDLRTPLNSVLAFNSTL